MVKLGFENFFFKIHIGRTFLKFSFKTSLFFFRIKRIQFFFDWEISETFICFRGVFNLNGYMGKKVKKNFVMGLNIWWSWGSGFFFNFSCKTSGVWGAGCFFGGTFLSFFGHFFLQNFSFLRGWEVFLSKKIQFFSGKNYVFAGLDALFE